MIKLLKRLAYRFTYYKKPFIIIEFNEHFKHHGTFKLYNELLSDFGYYATILHVDVVYDFKKGFIKCRTHYRHKEYLKYNFDYNEITMEMLKENFKGL